MISAFVEALRFPVVAFRQKDVLGAFVRRDLTARYKGSLLGRLWPVLHPLVLLGVFGLVFLGHARARRCRTSTRIRRPRDGSSSSSCSRASCRVIAFQESVHRGTHVVIENSNLIKKIVFPSELLSTQVVLVGAVQLLIGIALFLPVYCGAILGAPTRR